MRSTNTCIIKPIAVNPALPVCPDCGSGMARKYEQEPVFACVDCGTVQRVETLNETQSTRQQANMHDRGTNRLLEVLRRHCA
jgi:DNA-directed RNA polymerase subunit M/transcription elongation factor TFIIS